MYVVHNIFQDQIIKVVAENEKNVENSQCVSLSYISNWFIFSFYLIHIINDPIFFGLWFSFVKNPIPQGHWVEDSK